MKKILLMICIVLTSSVYANEFAAGLILGTPTGLSGKFQKNDRNAFQIDFSTSYSTLDYLWYDDRNFDVDEIDWFYGVGAVLKNNGAGARAVSGIEYDIKDYPFHLLGNLSYSLLAEKKLSQYIGIAIGARYDF